MFIHDTAVLRRRWFALVSFAALACGGGSSSGPGPAPAVAAAPVVNAAAAPTAGSADVAGLTSVFDFEANRVHAFIHDAGRLSVKAGAPEFLKVVEGGWKTSWALAQKDSDRPVAFISGLSSVLFVPIDSDGDGIGGEHLGDLVLSIEARALTPGQKVSVFFNEKAVATLDVPAQWSTLVATVPAALAKTGENRVRLTFKSAANLPGGRRSAAAVAAVALGPAAAGPGSAPRSEFACDVGVAAGAGAAKSAGCAFTSAGPSRLSYYLPLPKDARLAVTYAGRLAGANVLVRVARDGAPARTLFAGPASATPTSAAWDLAAFGGQTVRIDFVSRGGGVVWSGARLLVKPAPGPVPPPAKKFDRIYIWMVDTLRADKVRVYNPKSIVETPNYDAFAADSTRFAWAQVPGTWSLPSHASILTGVYPSVHKAIAHEARLSKTVPFVAETLKKAGWRTGIFSSNGYVSSKWGFDRGWDINRNFIRESLPNGADYLWKTTKEWINANPLKGKPLFLYLATVEPHVIYNPKKQFFVKYWDKPYTGPIKPAMTGIQLGLIKSGKLKVNDTDKAYLEALHNAEITQSDHEFGVFVADLKKQGVYDNSAIIVVSDHGDEFWDHGDVGHAQSVHQELVHVPLLIRAPGAFPQGKVVDADVEAMDLYPTVLELAGLEAGADVQGAALLPLALDPAPGPRTAMSQNVGQTRGVKVARYRLINAGLGRLELYDEIADPREQKNLADTHALALRQMRNVLGLLVGFENRWKKPTWGTSANVSEGFAAAAAAVAPAAAP